MGRDKALLPYQGSTFLSHLIALLLPRVEPLIVVLGHHAGEIAATLPPAGGLRVVANPGYQRGMLSSLQTGLGAVREAPAILFTLVDHPAVRAPTIDRLVEQFLRDNPAVAIPRYNERRGHPVILSRTIADEILALAPGSSAKQVMHAHHDETQFVDVDDPGILRDVDLPAEYESLLRDPDGGTDS
jgi:molybdenum cofactor cytidylyltransferase